MAPVGAEDLAPLAGGHQSFGESGSHDHFIGPTGTGRPLAGQWNLALTDSGHESLRHDSESGGIPVGRRASRRASLDYSFTPCTSALAGPGRGSASLSGLELEAAKGSPSLSLGGATGSLGPALGMMPLRLVVDHQSESPQAVRSASARKSLSHALSHHTPGLGVGSHPQAVAASSVFPFSSSPGPVRVTDHARSPQTPHRQGTSSPAFKLCWGKH
jgi:hypothetical protein